MDKILEHEDWQHQPLQTFIAGARGRLGLAMTAQTDIRGTVEAYVNHGRWIVNCPAPGCNSAIIASSQDRRFLCAECDSGWYTVVFPPEKMTIEILLLRRPLDRNGLAPSRNWRPGETVIRLVAENVRRGIL